MFQAMLSWLFDRLYNQLACAYDLVSWLVSGGRWRQWQSLVLPYIVGPRVLEVGPGPGHLLAVLLAAGYDTSGLELSPAMLGIARRRLAKRGEADRLVAGDARCAPFPDESFDSIVATFPSPYVLEPSFCAEANRLLRPGGQMVVLLAAESHAWPWPGVLEWALRRAAGGAREEPRPPDWPALSPRLTEVRGPLGTGWLLLGAREESWRAPR